MMTIAEAILKNNEALKDISSKLVFIKILMTIT